MAQSHQDYLAAQIAVREATQSLLAAEKRYHAAIACPVHRLIYDPTREKSASPVTADDIHRAAAAYGAAAARLREAYQRIREVQKQHPDHRDMPSVHSDANHPTRHGLSVVPVRGQVAKNP